MRSRHIRQRANGQRVLQGIFTTVRPSSIFPDTYAGLPADMDDWSCGHWKVYYERNKAKSGKTAAGQLLLSDVGRVGMWADVHMCKYNCDWVQFFEGEGLPGGNIFSKLYCTVDNVADTAQNTTQFTKTLTGNGILFAALIGGGIYFYNKYGKKK